jgi:hypothetical protein
MILRSQKKLLTRLVANASFRRIGQLNIVYNRVRFPAALARGFRMEVSMRRSVSQRFLLFFPVLTLLFAAPLVIAQHTEGQISVTVLDRQSAVILAQASS